MSKDFFLKSSSLGTRSLYQISNDNSQKDNFYNLILSIDKMVALGISSSTILTKLSLSKGDGGWGKDLRNATVVVA